MLETGLVQVYTGETEEMNYAPLGLSLRAAGQGLRSLITSFAPYPLMEGAERAASALGTLITFDHAALPIHGEGKSKDRSAERIRGAFNRAKEAFWGGAFDLVILTGIHRPLDEGIISLRDLLDLIEGRPEHSELILCGRRVDDQILDLAHLVTEMVVHKWQPMALEPGNCPQGQGTIEVVTGNGKGKTTYCLGKAMLFSGLGIPALIVQFIKSPQLYGEVKAISKLPHLTIRTMGKGFLIKHSPYLDEKHKTAAKEAWNLWVQQIYSHDYGLLVLDEINIATSRGLISGERVKEMLFVQPQKFHILLSGRNAHPDVIKSASIVLEMKEIKHPFRMAIKARKGIEF